MSLPLRARLTLWYTAVLSLVLAASAWASYLGYERSRLARIDAELARTATLAARSMGVELGDGLPLPEAAHDALEDLDVPDRPLAVFAPDGSRLSGRWEGLPEASGAERGSPAYDVARVTAAAAVRYRVRWARHLDYGTEYVVATAESLAPLEQELRGLRRALLGGVVAALVLAAGGGFWLARGALGPLSQMAVEAQRITDRTAGARLSAPRSHDELALLAEAFNGLLGRLERALTQQRQFMADASHELRTPVSVARTAVEVSLSRAGRAEAEYRDSLAVVSEQTWRVSRLVEDMFTLARADIAPLPLERRRLYLDELVEACVRDARLLGAEKGLGVAWSGPQDVETSGDERRLRHMLMNLLSNAIRHTPAGGSVGVGLERGDGGFVISVSDGGPGVPESERERIFERFVRLDAARGSDGAGLGLPIARVIAEAHGGSLVLAKSGASGSTFLVRLPAEAG